jgi:hypothetical protein
VKDARRDKYHGSTVYTRHVKPMRIAKLRRTGTAKICFLKAEGWRSTCVMYTDSLLRYERKVERLAGAGWKGAGVEGADEVGVFPDRRLTFFVMVEVAFEVNGQMPTEQEAGRVFGERDDVSACARRRRAP